MAPADLGLLLAEALAQQTLRYTEQLHAAEAVADIESATSWS
ncbi:MAG: hypothetical protein ACRYG7_43640 [Janthinobacterium lividum]